MSWEALLLAHSWQQQLSRCCLSLDNCNSWQTRLPHPNAMCRSCWRKQGSKASGRLAMHPCASQTPPPLFSPIFIWRLHQFTLESQPPPPTPLPVVVQHEVAEAGVHTVISRPLSRQGTWQRRAACNMVGP